MININVGDIFDTRKVIDIFYYKKRHRIMAKTICQKCGEEAIVSPYDLKNGRKCKCTKNKYEKIRSKDRLYRIWSHIKDRCYNINCDRYYLYGAKGIQMCDEWKNDFISFALWAWDNGYDDELTIDRIDSSKNYCPENCQWITRSNNTIKSNKLCQHRMANKGLYFYQYKDEFGTFDNANAFAKQHELDPEKVRYYSNINTNRDEKIEYDDWLFWHENNN